MRRSGAIDYATIAIGRLAPSISLRISVFPNVCVPRGDAKQVNPADSSAGFAIPSSIG